MSYAPVPALTQLSRGHIDGFITSIGTDTDHDIDIAAGEARDSTNSTNIKSSSVITKQIDIDWVAGSGTGGFPSGLTLTADTPYFVFVVSNADASSVDAGFDSDPQAVNLLLDTGALSLFRRIGCVVTDGSVNILPFRQDGDRFDYDLPFQDISVSGPGTSQRTHQLTHVPVGIQHILHCSINWTPTSADNWSGYVQYGSSSATFATVPSASDNDGGPRADGRIVQHSPSILLNADGIVMTRQSNSTGSLRLTIQLHGWTDNRGRDGTI